MGIIIGGGDSQGCQKGLLLVRTQEQLLLHWLQVGLLPIQVSKVTSKEI
jgi:hypothetical protein